MNYYAKNNRKEIVLVALLVAIVGMSLGFAAFSSTLSISSSATVTPNSTDFSLMFCNVATIGDCDPLEQTFIDQKVNGATPDNRFAYAYGDGMFDLDAHFTTTNQSVVYKFYVQNVGEYDAYLRGISYTALDNGTYKKCSATTADETKATDSLVLDVCEGVNVTISIGGTTYDLDSNISGHKLSKNSAEEVLFTIEYVDGSALADGPFRVDISDFKLNYSTVDSTAQSIS